MVGYEKSISKITKKHIKNQGILERNIITKKFKENAHKFVSNAAGSFEFSFLGSSGA